MKEHSACKEIVKIGKEAVPWLLEDLQRYGSWKIIIALSLIVKNDAPNTSKDHTGRFELIRKDWLEWGIRNDYIKASI